MAAYDRLLNGTADPAVRVQASHRLGGLGGRDPVARGGLRGPASALGRRAVSRSGSRGSSPTTSRTPRSLEEDELLRNAHRLAGIPAVLLHGRLDLSGPPDVAWQLAQAWPGAELTFIPGGHTGDEEMDRLLLEATARFSGG